jgi:hypothetical protein
MIQQYIYIHKYMKLYYYICDGDSYFVISRKSFRISEMANIHRVHTASLLYIGLFKYLLFCGQWD